MGSEEGRSILAKAFADYQPPPWWVHVDLHCQHLQEYLNQVLDEHFAPPARGKATYIPEEVWTWRERKLALKRRTGPRKSLWRQAVEAAFHQWRYEAEDLVRPLLTKQSMLYQLTASAIGFITARMKKTIHAAKAAYLQTLVADGPQSAADILQRAKRCGLGGRTKMNGQRPLPLLLDDQGNPAKCQDDHDRIWLKHFSDQEYGQIMPPAEFLKQHDVASQIGREVTWELADLPTVQEIEAICRTAPKNKAVGLDGLPGEILRVCPAQAAMALAPLFLKAACGLQQPIQWRGGVIYSAWKRAGEISLPANHRSLFISSVVGKCYHRLLRNKTHRSLQAELHPLHLGSRAQAPLVFASLYVFSRFRACRAARRSMGMIFLDTTAAYYRVLRETVVGDINHDDTIIWLMKRFHMGPEEMAGLWEVIHGGGVMAEAGVSTGLRAMMKDVHHRTWCITRHATGSRVAVTHAGSRPGESLADAIFAYIYSRVLGRIWEAACGEEILGTARAAMDEGVFSVPGHGEDVSVRDITWADDTALPFDDVEPDRCIRKGKRLASLTIDICRDFGLQPNLKRGKTAIVLSLAGKGIRKAREKHFRHGRSTLQLVDLQEEVHVVPQYVHLGGVVEPQMHMKAEQRRRLAMAGAALEAGKKLIFLNADIPLQVRTKLFETSILSTFFNLAIWLPQGETWQALSYGYTRMLRRLLCHRYKGDAIFGIPAPFVHIATGRWKLELHAAKCRLAALVSLARTGPEELWAVLQEERTWMQVVANDLAGLKTKYVDLPDLHAGDWPRWKHYLVHNTAQFKLRVKKKLQEVHDSTCRLDAIVVGMWQFYRQLCDQLPGAQKLESRWSCRGCRKTFKSKGGLGAHFFKSHGREAEHRRCIQGSVCMACGRQFWSSIRLGHHLRDSRLCVQQLLRQGHLAKHTLPGQGSREYRKRAVDEYNMAPARQLLTPSAAEGEDYIWPECQKQASREISAVLLEAEHGQDEATIIAAMLRVLQRHPLYFGEEEAILAKAKQEVDNLTEEDVSGTGAAGKLDLFRRVFGCQHDWHVPVTDVAENEKMQAVSLATFQGEWKTLDWPALLRICTDRVTPEAAPVILDLKWEASNVKFSGASEVEAAIDDPMCFVPGQVSALCRQALQGYVSKVVAPASFWESPFGHVFRSLREPLQP